MLTSSNCFPPILGSTATAKQSNTLTGSSLKALAIRESWGDCLFGSCYFYAQKFLSADRLCGRGMQQVYWFNSLHVASCLWFAVSIKWGIRVLDYVSELDKDMTGGTRIMFSVENQPTKTR